MYYRCVSSLLLLVFSSFALPAMGAGSEASEGPGEVNVYSHRHYDVDRELYSRFTAKTGIAVNIVEAGADELIQRLASEGKRSPADLLITVDAGRLHRAKEMGLLQPVTSDLLEELVPEHLRDPENYWFALTVRARVIVYHRERVEPSDLSTYQSLTDPRWSGKIAIRSSTNIYNQSLLASIIAHEGLEEAKTWAEGMVANFARDPHGNDRDQMKAIAAGMADLAVVNTYYVGRMLTSEDPAEVEVANQVAIHFPNQEDRGTHINVSGVGVTSSSSNRENALRLIEFLLTGESQAHFAAANYEYPVRDDIPLADEVAGWGEFSEDRLNLSQLGANNEEASKIFDQVGWR